MYCTTIVVAMSSLVVVLFPTVVDMLPYLSRSLYRTRHMRNLGIWMITTLNRFAAYVTVLLHDSFLCVVCESVLYQMVD